VAARLSRPDASEWRDDHVATFGRDGRVVFRGLVRGARYALLVPAGRTGRVALVPLGEVPTDGRELVLRPVEGRSISGRVVPPRDAALGKAELELVGAGWRLTAAVEPDGRFEVHGVPDAPFDLRAEMSSGGWYRGEVKDLRAGGAPIDLPLAPTR
jgi:hypothetical protein